MTDSLLLHSGHVFTGTELHPTATAVLVQGGQIAAVGTDAELEAACPRAVRRIDLQGGLITPGFVDAHVHLVMGGVERNSCDLTSAEGREEALETIRAYAETLPVTDRPGSEWIVGGGWYKGDFPPGAATAELLDTVTGDRPAYLINADHHGAWVNTAALQRAGVTADTPDPADGVIERAPDGSPSGILHEGAMNLVGDHLPEHTPEELAAGLSAGVEYLHSVGVTGWQEAILGDYAGYSDVSTAYRRAREQGVVTETATGALWVPRDITVESVPALVEDFVRRREENARAGFTSRAAKIMVDGVPENRTAAMLEAYCSCERLTEGSSNAGPDGRGLAYLDHEVLLAVGTALDAAGFDLHFHAIGDRAVRWALDTVEAVHAANPDTTARHHIAHIQIVHPDDVPRFASTGAAANLQALWACNDAQMQDQTVPLIGQERAGWQYPFHSIHAAGARLCMGSDWPVSTPDPWQALHVAVNRTYPPTLDAAVGKNPPLEPGEALELTTALAAYTAGSAWQLHLEDRGRIEPGMVADLAVADRNPLAPDVDPLEICQTRTVLTLSNGEVVHDGR
ncbi:amidohydrolase [Micrococcus terreus]|uniref:amidohydrolase n=1 Tax=Micrococcus terreus TaxID=574650 RepID=UPI0023FA108F|nr:amidohydrolase [Micrococcus terreus]